MKGLVPMNEEIKILRNSIPSGSLNSLERLSLMMSSESQELSL